MFGQKRVRTDGQLSRAEYEAQEVPRFGAPAGMFPRASPDTMASRRLVTSGRVDRRTEFFKQMRALNGAFAGYCRQIAADSSNLRQSLGDLAGDYLSYASAIEARFVRRAGEVLTFGNGDCGQLAHGTEAFEDMVVRVPRRVLKLRNRQVTAVACGGLHNVAVTASGEVYTWGCNDDGSLGRTGDENFPALVEGLGEGICGVAAGETQTFVFSVEGCVWGWGCYKDAEGKQWFDKEPSQTSQSVKRKQASPMQISGLDNVTSLVCGATFNAATSSDGAVLTWGLGENGEMGRACPPLRRQDGTFDFAAAVSEHLRPQAPVFHGGSPGAVVENVRAVGAGAYHILVVVGAASGADVFASGMNNYGQLGIGPVADDDRKRVGLTRIPGLQHAKITAVCGGLHHSLAMSAVTGAAYAWGRGDYGQIGVYEARPAAGAFEASPVRVQLPKGTVATQIAAGSHHNLLVTEAKELYTWGYGEMSQLGHGGESDKDELKPRRVAFESIAASVDALQVAGGGQHSVVVAETKGF